MPTVTVQLPHHRYDIHIAPGSLRQAGAMVRTLLPHAAAGVLADGNVMDTHAPIVIKSMQEAGYRLTAGPVTPGEEHKNLRTVSQLYDVLLNAKLERKSPVLAVGGGVIGDTVGFVAATYLRGVPFVQIPTTLLAMVDSSIGGKVGVNVPHGKNLVGAFYHPHVVVIDPQTLRTLPVREIRCGLAECVKHGVIRSEANFTWLEKNLPAILALDMPALTDLVRWNVETKAKVVMADEKETGERAHLNFGHTFGHAIEATAGYGTFHHGEAVALGMIAATALALDLKRCATDLLPRLRALLQAIGLPITAANLPPVDTLMEAMTLDKKVAAGKIRFVLPTQMGAVEINSDVPPQAVRNAWEVIRS